jgi:hypothetical protein
MLANNELPACNCVARMQFIFSNAGLTKLL